MAGIIKANTLQLGDSSTATQNFVWQTNVDGTAKLARGNAGATTQDILTVSAAGVVTLTQAVATQFTSSTQTITSGGALTIAHGLSFTPRAFDVLLTNLTAEYGYSIGDVVNVTTFPDSSNARGVVVVADATNLSIRFGSNANTFNVLIKTTGGAAGATNGNWNVTFRARA